jgi:hypothetical protein
MDAIRPDLDEKTLGFVLYCVDILADRTGESRASVYKRLAYDTDVLERVIVGGYDVLHTQGEAYICDDILEELGIKR